MRPYLLALDIGGTHARLAVQLRGQAPRLYEAPGFTLPQNGPAETARRCAALLREPLAALGCPPAGCAALCCGASGVDGEAARAQYREIFTGLGFLPGAVQVYNDCELPLLELDGPAVLLAAGTGSLALARDASGTIARCGGWGLFTSDEGSAARLALEALACAVRAWDGACTSPALTGLLQSEAGISCPLEAERFARTAAADKSRLAALAPLVCRAAAQGDAPVLELLHRQAALLAQAAACAAGKLKLCRPPVVLWGSLLLKTHALRAPLVPELAARGLGSARAAEHTALEAALALAERAAWKEDGL